MSATVNGNGTLVYWALVNGQVLLVMVDSGVTDSFMKSSVAQRRGLAASAKATTDIIEVADGSLMSSSQVVHAPYSLGTHSSDEEPVSE